MGSLSSGGEPEISVVIASFSSEEALVRCLGSLLPQAREMGAEVVVARNAPAAALAELAARYPDVRFTSGPARADVFSLRSAGAKESRGRLVALTEDHVTVAPAWLAALRAAHAPGAGILGGPVDNGRRASAYDWALYFCEYGVYMPPVPEGDAAILSGINIAYDRALLDRTAPIWERELRENEVNAALLAVGERLHAVPQATVTSHLDMPLGVAAAHLFQGGRVYGAWRRTTLPAWKRVALAAASPLVAPLLMLRIARRTAARQPALMVELARGLPFVLMLLLAWSIGEAAGSWGAGPREEGRA